MHEQLSIESNETLDKAVAATMFSMQLLAVLKEARHDFLSARSSIISLPSSSASCVSELQMMT